MKFRVVLNVISYIIFYSNKFYSYKPMFFESPKNVLFYQSKLKFSNGKYLKLDDSQIKVK